MESSSVCNHTSHNKIGLPLRGSPICLSRVWLQTELDDTKSSYQLIIKITISEKKRIAKLYKCRFENNSNGFAGCQVTSEKQVSCQSKTQPCMKNAQLRRTLQKLVKIPNASIWNLKFLSWVGVDIQLTSSCKHQSQSQWWFFVSLAFRDGYFLLSCWCFDHKTV